MDILEARDRRVQKQQELLQKHGKTLVSFTMNIAGPVKVSRPIEAAFRTGDLLIREQLSIIEQVETSAKTGFEKFYVVEQGPKATKEICLHMETLVPFGRLFDLDVLTPDNQKISRSDLGLPPQKCLLCEKDAVICGSSRAHSVPELQNATGKLLRSAIPEYISRLAVKSLITEVEPTPQPGLVDRNNSGSHQDMDIQAFYRSASALKSYFYSCAGTQAESPKALFAALRPLGMEAEQDMLAATGGVNTHKGAIFSMGILCAAAAQCFPDTADILNYCAQMTEGLIAQDFGSITQPKTAGERLYVEHGITGIRGQAEQGFPAILQVGLPILQEGLRRGLSINDAGCAVLLHLLAVTDDTNMISRSDLATLREIQSRLQAMLADDPYPDLQTIFKLDEEFIQKNLSPGGSADLLALTYFLYFLTT